VGSNWVATTSPLPVLSGDGATLYAGSGGSLTTAEGTWTFGSSRTAGGQIILLNGNSAGSGAITLVAEDGRLYADNAHGHWYEYLNSQWIATTDPTHTAAPSPALVAASSTTPTASGWASLAPTNSDGAGHDLFVFNNMPQTPGHIADFSANDILDLIPLLKAAGYTGASAIASHVVTLAPVGADGTAVMIDPTGQDPNHGHAVVTLDHVTPQNVHAANIWT